MSGSKSEYFFLPGRAPRNSKAGVPGPGVLVIMASISISGIGLVRILLSGQCIVYRKGILSFYVRLRPL